MKRQNYLTIAVTAMTLVAFTTSVKADDQSKATTAPAKAQAAGGFGKIERANKLIGKSVLTSDRQKAGKISNAVVDIETGRILYAVVSVGGVAGVGGTDVAVAPGAFSAETPDSVLVNADKQKLQNAPQFTSDVSKPDQLGQASFVDKVYQHFGQASWWQGGSKAANEGSFNNAHKVSDLGGMKVLDVNNQAIAKVKNTMLDLHGGRVAYVVISPDSSLKLGGNNYYALPPNALTLSSDKQNLVTGITREKFASAPHFDENGWGTLANPSYASQIYNYYGKQAYFGTDQGLQPTGR